jgi:hypothetical protein
MIQATADSPVTVEIGTEFFERRVARLLIAMYFCGSPANSLLEGETRQVESLTRLQQFDFWLREPGHLALALISIRLATPDVFAESGEVLRKALDFILDSENVDRHRVESPWKSIADWDDTLSFLTSRALASDRPSFMKGQSHQIILETDGLALARRIISTCPSYNWYRVQGETITRFLPILATVDLTTMPYLAPNLTATTAATTRLTPLIRARMTF